ncbi:MAG TPA: hypothetical protein VHF27_07675 [Acidimicrobiales bacterium]|nr:hypothetical protein [Acidimicrobiales bacterium]
MSALLIVLGVLVLTVTGIDVLWTVLAAGSGAGPLTGRLSALAWRVALVFGRRPSGPRHALLAVSGIAIVVSMLLSWSGVTFGAWWLVASASDGAVRVAESGAPADLLERAWFVGYNLFTLGSTTYTAGDGLWQLLPVVTGASGLVLLTLGISYLVPVASAVAERRQLAQYVVSLGSTPSLLLTRTWSGKGFDALAQHLTALTPMVHLAGERHLTYPALAYFHSGREQASSSISVVVLDEAVTLLRCGVAPEARPDPAVLDPIRSAIDMFLEIVGGAFVAHETDPLPAPGLQVLREAGIPTVDDGDFGAAVGGEVRRRCLLAGLLLNDGWTPEHWARRREALER